MSEDYKCTVYGYSLSTDILASAFEKASDLMIKKDSAYCWLSSNLEDNKMTLVYQCIQISDMNIYLYLSDEFHEVGFFLKFQKQNNINNMSYKTFEKGKMVNYEEFNNYQFRKINIAEKNIEYKYKSGFENINKDELLQKIIGNKKQIDSQIELIDTDIMNLTNKKNGFIDNLTEINKDLQLLCTHNEDKVIEHKYWDGHRTIKEYICSICDGIIVRNHSSNKRRKIN